MKRSIRIYVEGGGDSRDQKASLRQGFDAFFSGVKDKARNNSIRWRVVAAGSRAKCFDAFCNALQDHSDAFNILLVDAESEVCGEAQEHLQTRDGWTVVGDKNACHLMVQMMEAWLVADPVALATYYGQGFQGSSIPDNTNVEQVDKATLESALAAATRHTQRGSYKKIKHASDLLAIVDPAVVRGKAPHCERLFQTLESLV